MGLLAMLCSGLAQAQDRFEIQVYDSETAGPLNPGVELHLSHAFSGAAAGLSHLTLEPHLGFSDWAELGGYLQSALLPDGSFAYGGWKLRFKARLSERSAGWGFALNLELSDVPTPFEPNRWGSELRPIADVTWRRLYFAVNPIIDIDLAGAKAGQPQFQPAVKASVMLRPKLGAGVEYYGSVGGTQRLFAAADWETRWVDLNVGVGYGFVGDDRFLAKTILGLHPPSE